MSTETIDEGRRRFLLRATSVLGGIGAAAVAVPFYSSWWPTAKAQAAGAPIEVDISKLQTGGIVIVSWRGKPVWIVKRSPAVIDELPQHDNRLRDPQSLATQQPTYAKNEYRSIKPEILVLVGICTHLGCSPKYRPKVGELKADWPGGFYCPCHGSTFDMAGRVFQGVPAPLNLQVPPYTFKDNNIVAVGVDYNNIAKSDDNNA